jgi:ferritin-like metal-binding protein YciE
MATQTTRIRLSGKTPAQPQINTEDIGQLEAGRMLVIQQLEEAHASESAAITTHRAHIAMTPEGPYRKLLERHLEETRTQASLLQDRLTELGANRSVLAVGFGAAQTVLGQAFALSKGPVDLVRGRAGEEKLFKNAKDEVATEAQEIATYDGLEATARAVGDVKTAELAVRIRGQEERQLSALREQLPELANATVRAIAAGDASYDLQSTGAAQAVREVRDEVQDEVEELGDEVSTTAKRAKRTSQRTTRKAAGTAKRGTAKAAEKTQKSANKAASTVEKTADKAADRVEKTADKAADQVDKTTSASNGDLPIKNYDALNAGEINTRLSGLTPAELRRVETYENSHAKRSTVLERIQSLKQSS